MKLSRIQGIFLGVIVMAGGYVRFHALDRQSLWDDEMSTLTTISTPLPDLLARFSHYEVHPPLYFLQLRLWKKVGGDSLAVLRANSAFWGMISLVLMFILARGYLGSPGGLAATALMAFSPYHLAYSQELRPYALGIAESILALFLLELCFSDSPRWRYWILLGSVWTALLYTHYWGSFVVLAQFIYGWLQAPQPEIQRKAILTFIVSSVLFSFWLPVLWGQLHVITGLSFWVPPPAPVNLAQTFLAFTGLYFHHASLAFAVPCPIYLSYILCGFYLLLLVFGINRGPKAAAVWLLLGITIPYLISYLLPGLFVSYRYPSLMFPAFVILIASGVEDLPLRLLRVGALSALLLASIGSCLSYATTWQKANPKAVVSYVESLKQPKTVVIRPFYFARLFEYYDHGSMQVVDQHLLDSTEKRAALKGNKVVFIAFDVPDDPVRDALISEFHVVSSQHFPGYAHLGITVYVLQ